MNRFFNPDECPFEVLGFFEELTDATTNEFYGTRPVGEPTRPLGAAGRIEFEITCDLELSKGHKKVILRASPKRPKRVIGAIQVLCGRVK